MKFFSEQERHFDQLSQAVRNILGILEVLCSFPILGAVSEDLSCQQKNTEKAILTSQLARVGRLEYQILYLHVVKISRELYLALTIGSYIYSTLAILSCEL